MVFIETPIFTEDVKDLLTDAEYAALQIHLAMRPEAGDVIRGCGGLRKMRWAAMGKGKRGGVRVIYYHVAAAGQIRMLLIYRKGVQDDLTQVQKVALRLINDGWQ